MSNGQATIINFHQDDLGDWVAELSCGHQRHVRHNPPWTNHPWVMTAEGRARYIGVAIPCKYCQDEHQSIKPSL